MKMKSKILTLFLAVIMIVSTSIPAFAANSIGVTYEIKLTPENLTVSSSPQTVTMEINATTQIDWDGIQAKIYIPTGFKLKSIANKEVTLKASDFNLEPGAVSGKGSLGFQSESGENEKITNICVVIYEIAADTPAGTYKLGVEQLEITKDYGEIWESEGVVTKDFVINSGTPAPSDPAKPTINITGTYTYNGSEQTANVTGYDPATMNIAGNVGKNAGDYTVSVTSKTGKWADGSTDAVTKAWSIAKANPTVTNPTGLTGTKGNALSTVTLPTGWAWKAPTTVMNETGTKTFAAVYTPTDTANYNTKEANLTVAVSEPPVTHPTKPTINVTGTYTYTGSDITATVTGYDSATMNIAGNVGKNAGDYTVSVTSKTGKWADGSTTAVTKAWSIAKADPTVTVPTGLNGTKGNALSTVTLPTGWAWKAPTTVMNETGTKTFAAIYTPEDITNYNTKEENLTVIVSEPPATHPAKPTINVTGTYTYTGSDITATVTGYDSATMNIAGNVGKNAGDYTVSVTSKTGKWADGSTTAVTKSWSIAKADPTVTVPTGLNGTKGNALSTVTLPTGWAWKAPTTVMNETGTKTFAAIYTPEDTTNYNTKEENLTVIVSESPAIDPAKPEIDVTGTYIYTGSDITATVTGYDSATMNITGNVGKNAGDYTVSVTSKTGKWADGTTDAVTKAWSVAKAKPTGNPKYTSITTTGKTLADAALTTTGADFSVPGTVKWIADDGSDLADTTAVAANTYYKWLFTPTDTINYETLTGNIRLYYKSSGGGGSRRTRYTVTFEANGGSKITSQSVTKNTVAKEPTAPTKENFDFAGWYTDKEFKTKYDFSDKVTKSFTLYAKWTEKDNSANQIILTIGKKDAQVFGKTKSNDVAPKIEKDRTMLPARFVAENLGAKVEWDGEKELVTITGKNLKTDENVTILITIGAATAKVNGKEIKLDSPAFIENDRTYTPIRFISEELGASVEWIEKEQKVIITKPEIKKAETK